ncbi:uncharacterized protein [Manis javanica]|uniref:uncharacterized protein isoform X3 n=1 Tax=Manis javanica TaxID=9974 RepID=UPI003C6D010F
MIEAASSSSLSSRRASRWSLQSCGALSPSIRRASSASPLRQRAALTPGSFSHSACAAAPPAFSAHARALLPSLPRGCAGRRGSAARARLRGELGVSLGPGRQRERDAGAAGTSQAGAGEGLPARPRSDSRASFPWKRGPASPPAPPPPRFPEGLRPAARAQSPRRPFSERPPPAPRARRSRPSPPPGTATGRPQPCPRPPPAWRASNWVCRLIDLRYPPPAEEGAVARRIPSAGAAMTAPWAVPHAQHQEPRRSGVKSSRRKSSCRRGCCQGGSVALGVAWAASWGAEEPMASCPPPLGPETRLFQTALRQEEGCRPRPRKWSGTEHRISPSLEQTWGKRAKQ